MKNELYTYILEFKGGTYITQVLCESLDDSLSAWLTQIEKEIKEIKNIGIKTINQIRQQLKNNEIDKPSLLTGLKNVWYVGISTNIGFLFINIVMTVQ